MDVSFLGGERSALQLVQEIMAEEMDIVVGANILPGIVAITPEYIIESLSIESSREQEPILTNIPFSAVETARAKKTTRKNDLMQYVL